MPDEKKQWLNQNTFQCYILNAKITQDTCLHNQDLASQYAKMITGKLSVPELQEMFYSQGARLMEERYHFCRKCWDSNVKYYPPISKVNKCWGCSTIRISFKGSLCFECYRRFPAAMKSRYRGVSWHKNRGKWIAQFKGKYLGLFNFEADAAMAVNVALVGEYGRKAAEPLLNKIELEEVGE